MTAAASAAIAGWETRVETTAPRRIGVGIMDMRSLSRRSQAALAGRESAG